MAGNFTELKKIICKCERNPMRCVKSMGYLLLKTLWGKESITPNGLLSAMADLLGAALYAMMWMWPLKAAYVLFSVVANEATFSSKLSIKHLLFLFSLILYVFLTIYKGANN